MKVNKYSAVKFGFVGTASSLESFLTAVSLN